MKRYWLIAALALTLSLFAQPASATTADSAKNCDGGNQIKVCLTLNGTGPSVTSLRSSITNNTVADFCGTLYVSKNANTDWLDIPECVSVGDKVAVTWGIDHDPFDDGTVFCSQFVVDDGTLYGQPCVVTPIPPPHGARNTNKCDPLHSLKQCIYVAGFVVHVDYVKGTEYGIVGGSICGYEKRYENGVIKASSRLCVPKGSGSSSYVRWNVNRNYQQGTSICTRYRTDQGTWSGEPCGDIG